MTSASLHLAVALDGAGHHPAAWRHSTARPRELFTSDYWTALARVAERGLLDFLTIDDSFGMQSSDRLRPDARTDQVRGRLDAVLIASMLGPVTSHIGLVPTVIATHTEPFHVASAIATLDYVSTGRAGWRPRVSPLATDAAHVGRRHVPEFDPFLRDDPHVEHLLRDLFDEADDVVEVVRRLWDSWEDDAVVKDVATGRYIDRARLHYIDFEGRFFNVKGPSIVPRPPQGNPLIVALAHSTTPFEFAARSADVVLVTPPDAASVAPLVEAVRAAEQRVDRTLAPLRVLADLNVFVDDVAATAIARKGELDRLDGAEFVSDAATFVGTPDSLADLLIEWSGHGLDGFRLRPGVIGHDLDAVVDAVVPELQRRGSFRKSDDDLSLRERFGLGRPASRYATST